jgi:cell pole-organizing protein PopZ
MANAGKAGEPSMDEILASIRKIIADDPPTGKRPAVPPAPVAPESPAAAGLGARKSSIDDVLGLEGDGATTGSASSEHAANGRAVPSWLFPGATAKPTAPAPEALAVPQREPAQPFFGSQANAGGSSAFGEIVPQREAAIGSQPSPSHANGVKGPASGRIPEWSARPSSSAPINGKPASEATSKSAQAVAPAGPRPGSLFPDIRPTPAGLDPIVVPTSDEPARKVTSASVTTEAAKPQGDAAPAAMSAKSSGAASAAVAASAKAIATAGETTDARPAPVGPMAPPSAIADDAGTSPSATSPAVVDAVAPLAEAAVTMAASQPAAPQVDPVPPAAQQVSFDAAVPTVPKPTVLTVKPAAVKTGATATGDLVVNGAAAHGVRTLEDTVVDLLRPMLRQWLDDNMPRMVEKALRIELANSVKAGDDKPKH